MTPNSLNVGTNKCNPWKITKPSIGGTSSKISWAPQVTAPLPLEAISELFRRIKDNEASDLLEKLTNGKRPARSNQMVAVTDDFFQSRPNDIGPGDVKDDVLGFFSLVMSYAKNAKFEDEDTSMKELTTIMPRTEFITMFSMVKNRVPGPLLDLVAILACYERKDGKLV